MTDYGLTGLVKRRAEVTGEIEATHDRLRKLVADLKHLDATILQFDRLVAGPGTRGRRASTETALG